MTRKSGKSPGESAPEEAAEDPEAKKTATKKKAGSKKSGGAAAQAAAILEADDAAQKIQAHGESIGDDRATTATQSARVLAEIANQKPELLVPLIDRLVSALSSPHKRVVQTAADALPLLARIAPARVARQLDTLKGGFDDISKVGKDGTVRTFAALCVASVAYQKRLEPVLTKALGIADGRTLLKWTEIVLPALKGEPHARARAVVEDRLSDIPKPIAQKVADFLGIKLRPYLR